MLCPITDADEGWTNIGDSHVEADKASLVNGEPEDVVGEDGSEAIQTGMPLPEPYVPTAAEVAAHNLTHLPYRCWCPHCVAARRPNTQHRRQSQNHQRRD